MTTPARSFSKRPRTDASDRYAAFLSYNHTLDAPLAAALQTSLEQFGRVWYRRRALRLFRDSTNLGAAPQLWRSIEQALRRSEWFILLASPESARSTWVRREVDWWLANRSSERLILVVTAGSVAWDAVTERVDEVRTDALPPAYSAHRLPEPLWVDLRAVRAAEPTDPAYQAAVVDIAATLHGRPKDDLVGEQIRQHRRRRRSIAFAAVLLVVLTLTSILTATVAVSQRNQAEQLTRTATARLLLAQARTTLANDPRTALLLGEAAHGIAPGPESRFGLAELLMDTRYAGTLASSPAPLSAVAFSSDGHTVAAGGEDNTVVVWDLREPGSSVRIEQSIDAPTDRTEGPPGLPALPPVFARPPPRVNSVAFAPDGHTLATGNTDGVVMLWNVGDPAHPQRIGQPLNDHTSSVNSVEFNPDGRTLAAGGGDNGRSFAGIVENTVILWDVTDPAHPHRIGQPLTGHTFPVNAATFTADGRTLASGSSDGTVILWDVSDTGRPRRLGQPLIGRSGTDRTGMVYSVAFSPDGHTLAAAGYDVTTLWNVANPEHPQQIGAPLDGHTEAVISVAYAPDGRTLATSSSDNTVILWDVNDPARPQRFGEAVTGHTDPIDAVVFAPDGRTLATASRDRTVMLWDMTDPADPHRIGEPLAGRIGGVNALAFTPDGHTLATAGDDKNVVLWNLADPVGAQPIGSPLTGHTNAVNAVAIAPDGRMLATASTDGSVLMWDVRDLGSPRRLGEPLNTGAYNFTVNAVAISPDGRTLAIGGITPLTIWDVSDLAHPRQIWASSRPPGPTFMINTLAFAPDGQTLAAGGDGGRMDLWDVTTTAKPQRVGQLLTGHTAQVTSVAFTPDGHTLASGGEDREVIVWDTSDPARAQRIGQPLTGPADSVSSVAFGPDGRTLAVGSRDNTVTLWELSDRTRPKRIGQPLIVDTFPVESVAFTPNGRSLAAGSYGGTVVRWDLADLLLIRDHALEVACARTGGGMDPDRWAQVIPDLPYSDTCGTR